MTWTETHRRWQALRRVEEQLQDGADVPWDEEYAEIFGDREGLVAALRYRWELARTTQSDPTLRRPVRDEQLRRLAVRSRGVLRVLAEHDGPGEDQRVPA